jgi:hypothetical protein
MPRHPYALTLLLIMASVRAAMGQSSLAPEAGVLVLRNGQVIEGEVTRAGDKYLLTKGEGSELWLKNDEVELFCRSLLEAYEFKVQHLSGAGAKPHIELAKWCLRHGLHAKCADEIGAAMRLEPDNREGRELEIQLKLAVESPPPPTPIAPSSAGMTVDELEKSLRNLPRGSVEKFGAVVQPILLNRCGANQCHGPNAKSEFKLLRPPPGQIVSRRFTQRNLYSSLKYLDASNPEASRLVVMPQQRHGGALSAVFDKQTSPQLAELVAWAKLATAAPPARPVVPATIAPTSATLSQPAGGSNAASPPMPDAPPPQPPAASTVRVMRPPLEQPTGSAKSPPQFVPRDRYDPEIFNRQYHGKSN